MILLETTTVIKETTIISNEFTNETRYRTSFVTPNNHTQGGSFAFVLKFFTVEQPQRTAALQIHHRGTQNTHAPSTSMVSERRGLHSSSFQMETEDLWSKFFSLFFRYLHDAICYNMAWMKKTWTKTSVENSSFWTHHFFRLKTPQATEGMICHLRCNDALKGPGCWSRRCQGWRLDGWKQTKEFINVASSTISHKRYLLFRMYFEWVIPPQHLDGYVFVICKITEIHQSSLPHKPFFSIKHPL